MDAQKQPSQRSASLARMLAYVAVFLQGLAFWRTPIQDPDMGFHLLGGQWTRIHGAVPREDFVNAFNPTWIDYHWFGQVLMDMLLSWGGLPAVQLYCGFTMALFGIVLLRIAELSRRRSDPLLNTLLVFAVLCMLFGRVSSRPTTLAYLLVTAALMFLLEKRGRTLLTLLLLTALCANVHIYWVLIPGLWFIFRCLPRLSAQTSGRTRQTSSLGAWGGLFGLGVLGAFSPYGIFNPEPGLAAKLLNYFAFVDVATMPADLKHWIDELHGSFGQPSLFGAFTLIGLLLVARFSSRRELRCQVPCALLFFGTFLMSVDALKYAPFFLVASVPMLTPLLGKLLKSRSIDGRWTRASIMLSSVLMLWMGGLCLRQYPLRTANAKNALAALRQAQPIEACLAVPRFFPDQSDHPVRIVSYYHFGSWCAWALQHDALAATGQPANYRVTMDGRTQFVPAAELTAQFRMYFLRNGWDKTLADLRGDIVLVGRTQPLAQALYQMSGTWELVYVDENFALFRPRKTPR